jgi:hypothetical protein
LTFVKRDGAEIWYLRHDSPERSFPQITRDRP